MSNFQYDPFQQEAINYINEGHSVLVSAPTGAGKTVIAEHVINECLRKGEKVIYTAPIKALSNQKYREFQQSAKDSVGILTGDVTLNPGTSIQIMTTEIFRNKILENKYSLNEYSWIIFDEIHYLDDLERGSVWEESLIFFPEHMRLLGLSATVPNIREISKWLETIHNRPIKVVEEKKRPVPLHFFFQCQGDIYDKVDQVIKKGFRSPNVHHHRGGKLPPYAHVRPNRTMDLVRYLKNGDQLPCIYFAFSRKRTEYLAEEMHGFDFLNADEKKRIVTLYDELCVKFDLTSDSRTEAMKSLISRGIGYHHAGMLPTLKEVIEQLFTTRLLKMIFTTETFALGINMPARSVVFDELRKFYGTFYGPLKTRDFFQMAGRAGRRSIDTEGFVFSRINPHFISPQELERIIYSQPEKVNSQFNASYATLLNLYQTYGEELYDIYPKSFHHYQVRPFLRKQAVDLMKAKVSVLKDLGHIRDEQLTVKGTFASKVYGYELILSEMFEQGILENLSVEQLGILAVSIVYEPRKGTEKPAVSPSAQEMESVTRKIKRSIHKVENRHRIGTLSKRCYFHIVPAMERWMKNEAFEKIMERSDADEGEIVRFFRMSIQLLREIGDTPVSPSLKTRLHQAISLINRDVVDSEKQLRT